MSPERRLPAVPGYRVTRFVRAGSMGSLWEAQDRQGRQVALKVADQSRRLDQERVVRHYRREAAATLHLDHENLVRGYEVGETENGFPFIAMEYVEGETLTDRIRSSPLDEATALDVGIAIARALEYMHARDVVHRDVKPDNVMLTEGGGVKLVDLGLAEQANLDAPGCGSPGYASPEMMGRGKVGPASDLFALGVTLANAVLGKPVFPGESKREVLKNTISIEVTLPERVGEQPLSAGFRGVVEKLVEKSVRKRYQSAAEARLDLEAVRDGDRPFGVLLGTGERSRRTRRIVGTVLLALLAVGAFLWATSSKSERQSPQEAEGESAPQEDSAPPVDEAVDSALLFAEQYPDAMERARELLEGVEGRAMSADQQTRYAQAVASLERRRQSAARALFAKREAAARAHLEKGELEAMAAVFEAPWPTLFADTAFVERARTQARDWRTRALARFEPLRREATDALTRWEREPGAADAKVARALQTRLAEALRDGAMPGEIRPALDTLHASVGPWIARAQRAEGIRDGRAAVRAALEGDDAKARIDALRAFLRIDGIEGTEIDAQTREVLMRAGDLDRRLRLRVEAAGGRPWAGVLGGKWVFDSFPEAARLADVFGPVPMLWDPATPWRTSDSDLERHAEHAGEVAAWRWLQRAGPSDGASLKSLSGVRRYFSVAATASADALEPTPLWRELHARLSMALRAPGTSGVAVPQGAPPELIHWAKGDRTPKRRPAARGQSSLDAARSAYLADQPIKAWGLAREAVAADPGNAEAAVLCSVLLDALAKPLRTAAAEWFALSEARRAWDLDPALASAPATFARIALRINDIAPAALRARLRPSLLAAARRLQRLGSANASVLAYLLETEPAARKTLLIARDAHKRFPDDESILLSLARLEAEKGERVRAIAAFRRARDRMEARFPAWARDRLQRLEDDAN